MQLVAKDSTWRPKTNDGIQNLKKKFFDRWKFENGGG
jgi:hypothetical protein